jgi:hypothetical protein
MTNIPGNIMGNFCSAVCSTGVIAMCYQQPPPPDLFLFSQAQIPQDTEHYSRGFNMEKKGWEMLL